MEQDAVCNELVANLRVRNNAVPVIKLNPPYNMLMDLGKVSTGRDLHILLELFKFIIMQPYESQRLLDKLLITKEPRIIKIIEGIFF